MWGWLTLLFTPIRNQFSFRKVVPVSLFFWLNNPTNSYSGHFRFEHARILSIGAKLGITLFSMINGTERKYRGFHLNVTLQDFIHRLNSCKQILTLLCLMFT